MFFEAAFNLRRVVIDTQGVQFVYVLHRAKVRWAHLTPARRTPQGRTLTFYRVDDSGMEKRSYFVTLEQAKAILTFPSRRKWELSHELAGHLGLVSPPTVLITPQ